MTWRKKTSKQKVGTCHGSAKGAQNCTTHQPQHVTNHLHLFHLDLPPRHDRKLKRQMDAADIFEIQQKILEMNHLIWQQQGEECLGQGHTGMPWSHAPCWEIFWGCSSRKANENHLSFALLLSVRPSLPLVLRRTSLLPLALP